MDHEEVIARGLIELYHRGGIPPAEEEAFEAHFFSCPACAEQLELARGFERGLKVMAAEDLAREAVVRAGLVAWLARRGALARWGGACAALLLAAGLPLLWVARERGTLAGAREESAALRARTSELEARLADEQRRGSEERRALESRLASLEGARREGGGPPPRTVAEGPLVNTPVFLLALVRGSGEGEGATIDPSKGGSHFAIALDVEDTPGVASYRVTVTDGEGRERFRQVGVRRNSLETLLLTFPSSYFPAGDYRLRVETEPRTGSPVEVGRYRFRIALP